MGGSRVKTPRWIFNIMLVFVLSGFWHGANWTFLLWGTAYGVVYLIERMFKKINPIHSFRNCILKYTVHGFAIIKNFVLVTLIWVLFRATNLRQLKTLFQSIIHNFSVRDTFVVENKVWIFLLLFIFMDILLQNSRFDIWCSRRHPVVRWGIYALLLFSILVFSSVNNFPFIYFQF
jgi:D-alanyl-lipoteichoic acid acyltransferase DltB (MBOAT superfamily)